MSDRHPTRRTRVRRLAQRGHYDRDTLYAILDEGLVAHVGFAIDGQPYVIPMAYARAGDTLILHGSVASRLVRTLAGGLDVSVAVTLLDGIVLARSLFDHSMNYRSVVLFGRAHRVATHDEKRAALEALTEHLIPGRSRDARGPSPQELAATDVLVLPIDEGSAKIRSGPPGDSKPEDPAIWAGVIPLATVPGPPIPDPDVPEGMEPPGYVRQYRRPTP
jgi:hypothetical protein